MSTSLVLIGLLLLWGTIVGLDVVTAPQSMVCRPLVAGGITGLLAGLFQPELFQVSPVMTGLTVGAVLELCALDVLPVGASRYPDYGPATVAATYAALGWRPEVGLGASVAVGLVIAVLGGWAMQVVRRANAAAIQRRSGASSTSCAGRYLAQKPQDAVPEPGPASLAAPSAAQYAAIALPDPKGACA